MTYIVHIEKIDNKLIVYKAFYDDNFSWYGNRANCPTPIVSGNDVFSATEIEYKLAQYGLYETLVAYTGYRVKSNVV